MSVMRLQSVDLQVMTSTYRHPTVVALTGAAPHSSIAGQSKRGAIDLNMSHYEKDTRNVSINVTPPNPKRLFFFFLYLHHMSSTASSRSCEAWRTGLIRVQPLGSCSRDVLVPCRRWHSVQLISKNVKNFCEDMQHVKRR